MRQTRTHPAPAQCSLINMIDFSNVGEVPQPLEETLKFTEVPSTLLKCQSSLHFSHIIPHLFDSGAVERGSLIMLHDALEACQSILDINGGLAFLRCHAADL